MDRRTFLQRIGQTACAASLGGYSAWAHAPSTKAATVTLLHTNDTHSRIDPFTTGPYKGQGGIAQRAALIREIRSKQPHTLVIDAGDIFQGTPYFNLFHGRVELETMSLAGYDIAAIGNHDFDLGAEWLLTAIERYARFSFCSANLQFAQPAAQKWVRPYILRTVGGRKLGFFGLGVRCEGLIPAHLWRGVRYLDPITVSRKMVHLLREQHHCEAVIALSHLGFVGYRNEPGDMDLAKQVRGIDLIVGGHTHTFLAAPQRITNAFQEDTHIVQVGHSGVWLGQVDLHFAENHVQIKGTAHPIAPPSKALAPLGIRRSGTERVDLILHRFRDGAIFCGIFGQHTCAPCGVCCFVRRDHVFVRKFLPPSKTRMASNEAAPNSSKTRMGSK